MFRIACVLLLAFGAMPEARAGGEIGVGITDEVSGSSTEAAMLSWVGEQRMPWELSIGHIAERDDTVEAPSPTTTFIAVGRRLTWRNWFLSSGIALVDADNEILSGYGQFITGLGWRGKHLTVNVRHISNASTTGRNRGETFLLVGYAW